MPWTLFIQICILMVLGGGVALIVGAIVLSFKDKD